MISVLILWIQLNSLWLLKKNVECEIPDDEAEKITTVQQAIDYVEKKRVRLII